MKKNIHFSHNAWEEYTQWQQVDKRILKKINDLIKDIKKNGTKGIGKPEPLKHNLSGYWSKRINQEHRIVYKIEDSSIFIVQCKYHYSE